MNNQLVSSYMLKSLFKYVSTTQLGYCIILFYCMVVILNVPCLLSLFDFECSCNQLQHKVGHFCVIYHACAVLVITMLLFQAVESVSLRNNKNDEEMAVGMSQSYEPVSPCVATTESIISNEWSVHVQYFEPFSIVCIDKMPAFFAVMISLFFINIFESCNYTVNCKKTCHEKHEPATELLCPQLLRACQLPTCCNGAWRISVKSFETSIIEGEKIFRPNFSHSF